MIFAKVRWRLQQRTVHCLPLDVNPTYSTYSVKSIRNTFSRTPVLDHSGNVHEQYFLRHVRWKDSPMATTLAFVGEVYESPILPCWDYSITMLN